MNILKNKKKIAILGKGTAGSISAAQFNYETDCEIDWYRDPTTLTQSVGEASTLSLPRLLNQSLNTHYSELEEISATTKRGIRKINWGINGTKDFIHDFNLDLTGIHFDAVKLQDFIAKKLKNNINIIETSSPPITEIDCDHIIDCTGKPSEYSSFNKSEATPVNEAYVVNCYWNFPKYEYSFHIARPYGWVFVIPLQNRCSVGYMYNSNINTVEEVEEDIKNVFKQLDLVPSYDVTKWSFKNYYKKQNYTERTTYNGNASFFLEPLESTSTPFMNFINFYSVGVLYNKLTPEEANNYYLKEMDHIQRIISMHYLSGSSFKTKFWDYAIEQSQNFLKSNIKDPSFLNLYKFCKDFSYSKSLNYPHNMHGGSEVELGLMAPRSYVQNFEGLGLYNVIDNLLKQ